MTRQTAVKHMWRLRAKRFSCDIIQFSPDRDGWGIWLFRETLKTVAACELVERAEWDTWSNLITAIRQGV